MQSQSRRRGGLFAATASVLVGMASLLVVDASFVLNASAHENSVSAGLAYDAQAQGPVPIPPSECALQTTVAEPSFKVSNEGLILEGAIFDRDGNLLFCDVAGRRVLRLSPDKQLSIVVTLETLAPGGLAFHQRGRLFIAALDIPHGHGAIFAVNSDGSGLQAIIPSVAGYMPNDLVFGAAASTSRTSRALRPSPRAGCTTSRRTSRRARPCCRTWRWPTA